MIKRLEGRDDPRITQVDGDRHVASPDARRPLVSDLSPPGTYGNGQRHGGGDEQRVGSQVAIRQTKPVADLTNAEAYAAGFAAFKRYTRQKPEALRFLHGLLDDLGPAASTMSLLDIGAGDGVLTNPIAQRVGRAVAIEPNRAFVEQLRSGGLPVVADVLSPAALRSAKKKNGGETFDLILMSHVHYHFSADEMVRAQQLAYAQLAPGGRLVMIKTSRDDPTEAFKREHFQTHDQARLKEHERMHEALSVEALRAVFPTADVRVELIPTPLEAVPDLDVLAEISRIFISPPVGRSKFDGQMDQAARAYFGARVGLDGPISLAGTNDVIVITKPVDSATR